MELGWSLPRRKDYLGKLDPKAKEWDHPVPFQGRTVTLPVYRVPLDLPKYRLANGRTQAAQRQFLSENPSYESDFFSKDQELETAQQVQDDLLRRMLKGAGLWDYFKNIDTKQTDPLILSSEGFVVNGNRRLCAMRHLVEQDADKYKHFKYINVVILPPADEKAIDELEAILQVRQDIRADYTWIDRALMIRVRRDHHNYTEKELSNLYELSENEIKEMLDMLDYAEEYLSSRGMAGRYSVIENKGEYAFRQLVKQRKRVADSDSAREAIKIVTFALIDDPEGGRVYQAVPDAAKALPEIVEEIRKEFSHLTAEGIADKPLGDIGILGDTSPSEIDIALLKRVDIQEHRERLGEIVKEVIEREKAFEKDRARANAFVDRLVRVNALLSEANNILSYESKTEGAVQQLDCIEALVEAIRRSLDEQAKD